MSNRNHILWLLLIPHPMKEQRDFRVQQFKTYQHASNQQDEHNIVVKRPIEAEQIYQIDQDHYTNSNNNRYLREELKRVDVQNIQMDIQMSPRIQNTVNSRKKSLQYSFYELQCPICLQNVPDDQFAGFTKCSHNFCIKCSIKFIKQEMQNFHSVQCPTKGCGAFLNSNSVILTYLTADELEKLLEIQNKFNSDEELKIQIEDQIEISMHDKSINENQPEQRQQRLSRIISKKSADKKEGERKVVDNSLDVNNYSQTVPQIGSSLTGSESFATNQIIELEGVDNMRKSKAGGQNQLKNGDQRSEQQKIFPKKIFNLLCTQIWSNKWLNFFKLLPVSLIIVLALIVLLALWAISVILYFLLTWVLFVPFVWAIYEIWACFSRSIQNICLKNVIFGVSLFCFPLLFIFFYILTLSVILYDGLFKPDMSKVLRGNVSILLKCRKIYLSTDKKKGTCVCRVCEECERCEIRKSIFCLVF